MNLVHFLAEDNAVIAAAIRIVTAAREPVADVEEPALRRMSGLTGYSWRTHGAAATDWARQIQKAGGLGQLVA